MAKSVEDRGRGARQARRDEGAYCLYVTEEQRSPPGCIGREIDRLSHSRALSEPQSPYLSDLCGLCGSAVSPSPSPFVPDAQSDGAVSRRAQRSASGTTALFEVRCWIVSAHSPSSLTQFVREGGEVVERRWVGERVATGDGLGSSTEEQAFDGDF